MSPPRRAVLVGVLALAGVSAIASMQPTNLEGALKTSLGSNARAEPVRFGRDVRPILSDRCFLCHGPDRAKQQAGLRLDSFEAATAQREHGQAIVPFDASASLLMQRVASADPSKSMPPSDSGKHALSTQEREILSAWIDAGGAYESHWSFSAPVKSTPPQVAHDEVARNEVDAFILASLEARGIAPSDAATPETLARRVFLDLTGLPPTIEELDAFLANTRSDAFEQLVDRLLTTEPYRTRYAERMAVPWLDAARYADTAGIHMDAGRSIWPYRDWVIDAYRANMPFDQFVIEQLAGDLMPDATIDQKVASGFNRCHVTSDEGGAINEEYLVEYAADRTNTTGAVFLGLTVGCARCHDHKFDPVSTEDFYSLFAFFNSIEEPGVYSQVPDAKRALEPALEVPSPMHAVQVAALDGKIKELRNSRDAPDDAENAARVAFEAGFRSSENLAWVTPSIVSATSAQGAVMSAQADGSIVVSGSNPSVDEQTIVLHTEDVDIDGILLEALLDPANPNARVGRSPNGNAVLDAIEVEATSVKTGETRRVPLSWAWADVEQQNHDFNAINALRRDDGRVWAVNAHELPPSPRAALFLAQEPFGFEGGTNITVRLVYQSPYAQHIFARPRLTFAKFSEPFAKSFPVATSRWYIVGPFPNTSSKELYATRFGPEEGGTLALREKFGIDKNFEYRFAPGVNEASSVSLAQGVGAEYVAREIFAPTECEIELLLSSDDGIVVTLNGTEVHRNEVERSVAPESDRVRLPLRKGANALVCKVVNTGGAGGFYHREVPRAASLAPATLAFALPENRASAAALAAADIAWRSSHSPRYQALTTELKAFETDRAGLVANSPRTMVMQERMKPRDTFVLTRGLYNQPDPTRRVQRAVPKSLGVLAEGAPPDRLGLAQWLMSDQNPLTARVTVNRLWAQFFGQGIVRTVEDFGYQGEWPTHPELLDWLAVDFREHGWNVDHIVRKIVLSATYRQSSKLRTEVAAIDPDNRLLGWFPRARLGAEQIRDQALFVAGLLEERAGGPSVKPYQPSGLWEEVAMLQSNTRTYMQDEGEALYRRSLYTYWKRAVPPPTMLTLDAPTREFCTTRRITTNTPLQALVLWNDPQFVEAARAAAALSLAQPALDDDSRIRVLVRTMTGGAPDAHVSAVLRDALATFRARYGSAPEDAKALLAVGASPLPVGIPLAELAAWTMLANTVLASDAVIVKD
ncbi:MAG: DUF1553 domain-containing protein [Phycisphaerales bacterium]|nr:DUF1553 domain-containing protein [Phycisphaerales bacterium]